MKLKIIVETRFMNPMLGGQIQTTIKEFDIAHGSTAEGYYEKERKNVKKSGGYMDVTITIVEKL